jgi:hypothetical protein
MSYINLFNQPVFLHLCHSCSCKIANLCFYNFLILIKCKCPRGFYFYIIFCKRSNKHRHAKMLVTINNLKLQNMKKKQLKIKKITHLQSLSFSLTNSMGGGCGGCRNQACTEWCDWSTEGDGWIKCICAAF